MPLRKTWLVIAVAIVAISLLIVAAIASRRAARADAWQEIADRGAMRVAMDASYPPFESIDARGAFYGLDVDLARALGGLWGIDVQFVNIAFDGLYDALAARKADVILSALPYDDLMTREVIYSPAYFAGGQVIVALSAAEWFASELDLRGRVVAVELGAEGHAVLSRLNRDRGLSAEIMAVSEISEAAAAVQSGAAAALICDRVDALRLTSGGELSLVGEPLTVDPYVLAARMDSPRLAAEIASALEIFTADGTLSVLQRRWLEQKSEP
ncbi:MAG: ABC transporter substrate-binding protein [Anaerolineae bacterium]